STFRPAKLMIRRSTWPQPTIATWTRTGLAFMAASSVPTNTITTSTRKKKHATGRPRSRAENTNPSPSDHLNDDRRQTRRPTTGETMALTKSEIEDINQALQLRITELETHNSQLRHHNEQLAGQLSSLTTRAELLTASVRKLQGLNSADPRI